MKTPALILFCGACIFVAGLQFVGAEQLPKLFVLIDQSRAVVDHTSVASRRESRVQFDPAVIASIASISELSIPLFDSKAFAAIQASTEVRALDDITWRGKVVNGGFEGDVVLTFRKGFVAGLIYAPDAVYEIVPRGEQHVLIELDQSAFPECAGDVPSETTEASQRGSGVDSGDRIDVLVAYTTATKNILGGDAQAQVHAQQAIDATNTAYINSKIRQRVRLVHSEEYLYTETDSASSDLAALRTNVTIAALRNEHNADMVAMIGEISGACGIGYLMGSINGNPNNGFTATARSCAVGNLSFAHELGHNMGSHHNPENGSNATFPYGFGHWVNGRYRTVMSYVNPCTSGCTRVAYFSNPNVIYNEFATGVDDQRDNARSINNTADVIANYRYSGSSLTLSNFNGGESLPRNIARPLLWTSDEVAINVRIEISRDESTTWQTLIESTPNDGIEDIIVYGRPTRRARLRVVSEDSASVSDSSVKNFAIK